LGKVAPIGSTGPAALPPRPPGEHVLAESRSFSAHDCVCHHGTCSPTFEGAYPRAHVSVILQGTFRARSTEGTAVVTPGTLLLGNASAPYEYRHIDDGGDRSLVFDYPEELLEDVGRSLGLRLDARRAFRRVSIATSRASTEVVALARLALSTGDFEDLETAALGAAGIAVGLARDQPSSAAAISSRQARRVATTVRYVEAHFAQDCSLGTLAAVAGLSHFHFLRLFRTMTGQTPHQFVLATRLHAAATALRTTWPPVTSVALDAGFGDLANFIATFTKTFGRTPRAYRRQHPPR